MFAWHVHAIFVLITANHAGIGVSLLANKGHLDLANIGLVSSYLEHALVPNLKELRRFSLQ